MLYEELAAQNVLYGTEGVKGQSEDGYSSGESANASGDKYHVHGNSADWGWDITADGQNVVLWKGDAFEILPAKVILNFHDRDVDTSYLFKDEGGGEGNGGGENENTVELDGNADDWGWDLTEDGEGVVVWSATDFQILDAKVVLKFDDKEVDTSYLFEEEGGGGEGGGEEDTLVLEGNSDEYGWGPTEDGQAVVVWNDTYFKIVDAGTKLKFDDETVDTSDLASGAGEGSGESEGSGGHDHDDHDDSADDMGDDGSDDHSGHGAHQHDEMMSY